MGAVLSALCAPSSERLTGHWLGLGRFDHVLITLAKEQETLLQPERTVQSCHHASSHWSCFGRVVRSSFDLDEASWPPDQGVLVGVCGIKLAHGLRDALQTLDQVAEALAATLSDLQGHWLISSTTGWEDMVLIYWTQEFSALSQVIGKVRSLSVGAVQPPSPCNGVHAVLTTCTMAGIHLPPGSFDSDSARFNHERWVSMVSGRLAPARPIDWAVRFELRPGHFDPFVAELKDRIQSLPQPLAGSLVFRNVLGQYDFRVQHQGGTQQDWLLFLGLVALPLAAKERSLVRSMETHLHIDVPQFSEGPAAAEVQRHQVQNAASDNLDRITHACKASAIAPHALEMLHATHNRLVALQGDDLQHGTFTSVESLFLRLAEGLASEPDGIVELDRKLSPWLYWVERCLADRYRGTYPLGESVVPRLGTYQASHHGFLAAMDCIGQHAFGHALSAMNRVVTDPSPVPEMAVCCFIGSSPSPNALSFPRYMRCGFIELPAIMIFKLQELPVLLHEVGHLFVNAVKEHHELHSYLLPEDKVAAERVMVEIQEILAEMFACCACFDGDVIRHGENRLTILDSYLPDPNNKFTSSSRLISTLRLLGVHWLLQDTLLRYNSHTDARQAFRTEAITYIREELESNLVGNDPAFIAKLKGEAETAALHIADAMAAFAHVRTRRPKHEAMIQAIKSLCHRSDSTDEQPMPPLELMKTFISAPQTDLARDFLFIEEMVGKAVA